MFEIAVSENIRPGEFLMRLNMAYNFNRLLFMHSSLIDLINIKAMLVLFSLQAKNKTTPNVSFIRYPFRQIRPIICMIKVVSDLL